MFSLSGKKSLNTKIFLMWQVYESNVLTENDIYFPFIHRFQHLNYATPQLRCTDDATLAVGTKTT